MLRLIFAIFKAYKDNLFSIVIITNMDIPQLNFDMISKILNIRMETKKEERLHQEALEDWKDNFDYVDTEILSLFLKEPAKYDHLTKIEDSKYFSPFEVLEYLRE